MPARKKIKDKRVDKIFKAVIVFVIISSIFALGYSVKITFFPRETNDQIISQSTMQVPMTGRMSLTPYDKELARQMMDKNGDGKCDACGMPVEMCIDSGQMQCNMDSQSTIGVLGSQHIHADWKVYIDDQAVDFSEYAHMDRMRAGLSVSSFIHVDSGNPDPEKTGDVLHMHATGVPLWIFFESLGMKFNKDCIIFETQDEYCSSNGKTLKFYVNGELNQQYEKYIFNDLDEMLISYGNEDQQRIQQQLDSITNFAERH